MNIEANGPLSDRTRKQADRAAASTWAAPAVLRRRPPPIFVVGYPSDIGGADTECWHTARLWRSFGWDVRFIPTWRARAIWYTRLDQLGCQTVRCSLANLHAVPDLRNGIVVSFCNGQFLQIAGRLRELGCKLVWLNCMTWLFPQEIAHYRRHGPFDAYVFQSHFQRGELQPKLAEFGVRSEQCHLIRGAFCPDEFPFRPLPHRAGEPLVIGRLSRPDPDKFAVDTWEMFAKIAVPFRLRVMGWCSKVEAKLGPPPQWAECLPAGAETAQEFLGKLHCLVQINGGARENWPRVGLEAMSSGVPIIAPNAWGWREMIRRGETGYLCNTPDEVAGYVARLACDEELRRRVADSARCAVENEHADRNAFRCQWEGIVERLTGCAASRPCNAVEQVAQNES